jgi:hypothetical protein
VRSFVTSNHVLLRYTIAPCDDNLVYSPEKTKVAFPSHNGKDEIIDY